MDISQFMCHDLRARQKRRPKMMSANLITNDKDQRSGSAQSVESFVGKHCIALLY